MNTERELKMQLLREFANSQKPESIGFCRDAYKFLTEGEKATEGKTVVNTEMPTAVDLGLPSGLLWADRNVGALSPQDYGMFFSWGNVEGKRPKCDDNDWGENDDAFDGFYESDYKNTDGAKLDGDIDAAHDAATHNLGEPWRMPTSDEFLELYDNCTWVRKTQAGVNGYLVTSKINGNSIFLPCSGYGGGTSWGIRGSNGGFWSSSFYSAVYARYLYFYSGGVYPQDNYYRFYGFAVRAVQNNVSTK